MKSPDLLRTLLLVTLGVSAGTAASQTFDAAPAPAAAPSAELKQRIAQLGEHLKASQAALRRYEWIETSVIAKDGEEKSRKQMSCYYSADGTVTKVALAGATESKAGGPPGILPVGMLLKKVAAHKKEELKDYLERAGELARSYAPPQADRIRQALADGRLSINLGRPGEALELVLRDYLKPGDTLRIDLDLATNRVRSMQVSTWLETPDDAIDFDVTMAALADGTMHVSKSTLIARAKKLTLTVENSGYRRTAG